MTFEDTNNGKTVAIVSYITIIGLVVALVMNSKSATNLGRFHIRQSIGITVLAIASSVLGFIPLIGNIVFALVGLVILIALILGIVSAVKGEEKELPFLGSYFQKWFNMI